jgi:hypothetical protein
MHKLMIAGLMVVSIVVVGLGLLVWKTNQQIERTERLLCVEKIVAIAVVSLLVPDSQIDVDGRVTAARALNEQLKAC